MWLLKWLGKLYICDGLTSYKFPFPQLNFESPPTFTNLVEDYCRIFR